MFIPNSIHKSSVWFVVYVFLYTVFCDDRTLCYMKVLPLVYQIKLVKKCTSYMYSFYGFQRGKQSHTKLARARKLTYITRMIHIPVLDNFYTVIGTIYF